MKNSADFDAILEDDGFRSLTSEDFEALPFGSIRLDRADRVTLYNQAESALARRDAAEVLGKRFFEDVAPCTNNATFRGRLEELTRKGGKSARFDYLFLFPWGS